MESDGKTRSGAGRTLKVAAVDLFGLAGAGIFVAGVAQISVSGAFLVAGTMMMVLAVAVSRQIG